jgi:hypothetical protein
VTGVRRRSGIEGGEDDDGNNRADKSLPGLGRSGEGCATTGARAAGNLDRTRFVNQRQADSEPWRLVLM